jgi:maltooligosyltrehalose trehalohydrolase
LENLEKPASLEKDQRGYFSGLVIEAQAGMRYRYRLDGEQVRSDPCSQYQGESATFFAAVPAVSMGR